MTGSTLILPAIVAITVFVLYMIAMQLASKQESTRERVRRLAASGTPSQDTTEEDEIADSLRVDQDLSPLAASLEQFLHMVGVNTVAFRRNSQMRFYRAGVHSPDAPIFYLFFKRILSLFFLLAAFALVMKADIGLHRIIFYILAIIVGFLGFSGADMYLRNCREKREKVLQRSFPDALDLLLVCVESGLALDGALSRVCKELGRAHPDITQELNRTRLELTLLNDRSQALTNLAERTDMLAFRSLVTTLLQSEKFGTSLTDTLRVLSEDFRHTRLMLAEEKAGRLPVLMTIPLITLLLPALFLIILGPAILKVMDIFANK